jgi:membrane protein
VEEAPDPAAAPGPAASVTPDEAPEGPLAAATARIQQLRTRIERTLVWQIVDRMLEIEFIDRGIAVAGKAFLSLFPLIIVVAAFLPEAARRAILSTLVHHLGLTGGSLKEVRQAFTSADNVRKATGALGLIFTFFFASSFATALQRAFVRIWRRPHGGALLTYPRGFAWLAGYLVYMAVLGALREALGAGVIRLTMFLILAFVVSVAAWTTTPWLMLLGDVRFRALVATGVVTSVLIAGYTAVAPLWMPNTVASNQAQFGFFGVALSLISWLSGATICILLGGSTGAVLVGDEGVVGRISRLGVTSLLKEGARPSLPAPARPGRLADAFKRTALDEL